MALHLVPSSATQIWQKAEPLIAMKGQAKPNETASLADRLHSIKASGSGHVGQVMVAIKKIKLEYKKVITMQSQAQVAC